VTRLAGDAADPRGTTLLDAAMGTELGARGLPPGAPPERWVLERPEDVAAVHAAHRAAGAEVVLTCTFNLASPRLDGEALPPVDALAAAAVALARRAAPGARVAGALGPAWGAAAAEERAARYAGACAALARAGCDLLWLETSLALDDALLAARAASATGLPWAVTFAFREASGALVDAAGRPAAECLARAEQAGAVAVGLNCALPGAPVAALLAEAARRVRAPLVAKPSAGLPGSLAPPDAFAAWLVDLARAGATWLGGCCGATPAHLAAAARALRGERTPAPL
jgi:5-methyltetrahydrofolate--homocysteine methyltransferase